MDVSALSGYSTTISLINALSQTSPVTATSGLSGALSLASTQTSISSLGSLLNATEALATAANALAAPGAFAARQATSSNTSVATATAGTSTPTGAYTVQVNQLAQGQTLTTATQASSLVAIGTGAPTTLNFQFASGVSRSVSLGSSDNTLAAIASSINAAGIGIQARVAAASGGGFQLSLTGQTGAANAFTLGVTGDQAVADLLAYPPGGIGPNLTRQARDAQGLVNGGAFTASTNAVNTAATGLTVNLAATGSATLSVAANTEQTKTVSAFVEAYNAVQAGLGGLGRNSPSLGLSVFYLRDRLSGALNTDGQTGSAASLAQIGIAANASGTLALDTQKFQAALNANPDRVAGIFSNGGKGVAEQVAALAAKSLSPSSLLQVAAPALSSPANLAQTLRASLLSSVFDQQGLLQDFSSSVNLANQFLLASLSSTRSTGQSGNSLPDLPLARSQTLSRNLSSLGTQLNLVGPL